MLGIFNARKRKGEPYLSWFFPIFTDLVLREIHKRCDLVYPRGCVRPRVLSLRYRGGVYPYVKNPPIREYQPADATSRLSWADTSASTFGRLWGKKTRALPRSFLGLPFAPRKSLAGFVAASLTGTLTAVSFWGWFAPSVNRPVSWTWADGFSLSSAAGGCILSNVNQGRESFNFGGWMGLGIIGIFAGLVSGVAEALGD